MTKEEFFYQIIATIIGVIVGGIITIYITRRQKTRDAFIIFREQFIDDLIFLKTAKFEGITSISSRLKESDPKHLRAIEIIRPQMCSVQQKTLDETYENYRNPRRLDDSKKVKDILSFGLYNCDRETVKSTTGRDISGIDLALENIYKVLNVIK